MAKQQKEVLEETPITCKECLSDNIYAEVIQRGEWRGSREYRELVTRYTCLEESCGHYWEVKVAR